MKTFKIRFNSLNLKAQKRYLKFKGVSKVKKLAVIVEFCDQDDDDYDPANDPILSGNR